MQPSDNKLGSFSCDKGSSSAPSSLPRMGMYAKYTPIRVNFDLAPNLTPSDKKLGRGAAGLFWHFETAMTITNYSLLITN